MWPDTPLAALVFVVLWTALGIGLLWLVLRGFRGKRPARDYVVKFRKNPYGGWYYNIFLDDESIMLTGEHYTLSWLWICKIGVRRRIFWHRLRGHKQEASFEYSPGRPARKSRQIELDPGEPVDWESFERELDRKLGLRRR